MTKVDCYTTPHMVVRHSIDDIPDPKEFAMHAHDFYEILYFISGHGNYLVESNAYPLEPGCTLLMRPGEVHKLDIQTDQPYERFVIHFWETSVMGEPALRRQLLTPFLQRPLGVGNQFAAGEYDHEFLHRCMMRIGQQSRCESLDLMLTAMLPSVLAEFYYSYTRRQATDGAATAARSRTGDIIQYVNAHLLEDLTLDKLCRQFYISKSQLGRLFRAATGSTPWDYILVKRLIEARRLILAGVPATRAAAECGFRDYSAFYRAYRKRYALSPAAEREAAGRKKADV